MVSNFRETVLPRFSRDCRISVARKFMENHGTPRKPKDCENWRKSQKIMIFMERPGNTEMMQSLKFGQPFGCLFGLLVPSFYCLFFPHTLCSTEIHFWAP